MNHLRARLWLLLLAAAVLWNGGWVPCYAAKIVVGGDPMPPSAALIGQTSINVNWQIQFTGEPDHAYFSIKDPQNTVVYCEYIDYMGGGSIYTPPGCLYVDESAGFPQLSPIEGSSSWSVTSGSIPGVYQATIGFWSLDGSFEGSRTLDFYVAETVGNLRLCTFDDVDSDGSKDAEDGALTGWSVSFVLPAPFNTSYMKTTGIDGCTATQVDVPAGDYAISEIVQSGWTMTTPSSIPYSLGVPTGQTTEFWFGNHANPTAVAIRTLAATMIPQRPPIIVLAIMGGVLASGLSKVRRKGRRLDR